MRCIEARRWVMPLTKDQARLLVPLIIASRPYGAPRWDEDGVFAALHRVADRSLPEVVIASIRAACDANAKTPMVIASGGKAWESDAVPAEAKTRMSPPKRDQQCPHHPGQWADRCGGCRADQLAGPGYDDEPAPVPPRSWSPGDTTTGADACRAALRGAWRDERPDRVPGPRAGHGDRRAPADVPRAPAAPLGLGA